MSLACKMDGFFFVKESFANFLKSKNENFEIQFKINFKEIVIDVYHLGD